MATIYNMVYINVYLSAFRFSEAGYTIIVAYLGSTTTMMTTCSSLASPRSIEDKRILSLAVTLRNFNHTTVEATSFRSANHHFGYVSWKTIDRARNGLRPETIRKPISVREKKILRL